MTKKSPIKRTPDAIMAENAVATLTRVTKIDGQDPKKDKPLSQNPLWTILEVQPDRLGEEKYILAGSEAMLPNNASLFMALNFLIEDKIGRKSGINIDGFLKDFKKELKPWDRDNNSSSRSSQEEKPWSGILENLEWQWLYEKRPEEHKKQPGMVALKIWPNKKWNPKEFYFFFGGSKITAFWKFLDWFSTWWAFQFQPGGGLDRDAEEPGYFKPVRAEGFRLVIRLPNSPSPPWNRSKMGARQVAIPAPKKSAVDFSKLRSICGGITWGQWHCRLYLAPKGSAPKGLKGLSQIVVAGESPEKAEERAKEFARLSEWELVGKPTTTKREDSPTMKVYPGWIDLLRDEEREDSEQGRKSRGSAGKKIATIRAKFPIWLESIPEGWKAEVDKFLKGVEP